MAGVFISYRRDESAGYAGRIHERLASVLGSGSVFMDLDDINPGADFVKTIEGSLGTCDAVLVLIGKRWLEHRDAEGKRRLDDPRDFVRIEVAAALARDVRVIPVLLNKASMPSDAELPADLARLSRLQAIELSDERWDYDLGRLFDALGASTGGGRWLRRRMWWVVALIALVAAVGALTFMRVRPSPPSVQGEWQATIEYDWGATHQERLVFDVEGDGTLGGTASFLKVDRAIEEGSLTEDRISFITRTEETTGSETRQARHSYRGTIRGDTIDFVMQTDGGFSAHPAVRFTATRMTGEEK
jgi:hypothetical protein